VFVAAALAATTSGCEDKPQVCLSPVANEYRDATWTPPAADAGVDSHATAEPPPMPCLSVALPPDAGPKPRPCLKIAAPRDAGPGVCLTY